MVKLCISISIQFDSLGPGCGCIVPLFCNLMSFATCVRMCGWVGFNGLVPSFEHHLMTMCGNAQLGLLSLFKRSAHSAEPADDIILNILRICLLAESFNLLSCSVCPVWPRNGS